MQNYFQRLLDQELWANLRLLQAMQSIANPPEKAHQLLSHIVAASMIWYDRIQKQPLRVQAWDKFPLSDLDAMLRESHARYSELLRNATPEDLEQQVENINSSGKAFLCSVSDILTHVGIHAAYHRGQIVSLIRPLLAESVFLDFIVYARENPS